MTDSEMTRLSLGCLSVQWEQMSALLQSGLSLAPVITHHFGVGDYLEAFRTMGSGQSGKVILDWASL